MNKNYTPAKCREIGWGDKAEAFSQYMQAIEAEVIAICGMSIDDLPDHDFASAFEDEQDTSEVARELLEYAGFEFEH